MYLTTNEAKIDLDSNPFRLGSSKVDWCEPNYIVSNYIAEFWNTVSKFLCLPCPLSLSLSSWINSGSNNSFIPCLTIFILQAI